MEKQKIKLKEAFSPGPPSISPELFLGPKWNKKLSVTFPTKVLGVRRLHPDRTSKKARIHCYRPFPKPQLRRGKRLMPSKHHTFTSFIDQEMLTSAFSGAGGVPGAHLCSPPGTGRNLSLPSPPYCARPARACAQSTSIRGPRECHAAQPLPEAWQGAAGLATAPREAPDRGTPKFPATGPRCVSPSSSWISAPPSCRHAPPKGKEVASGRKCG